MIFLDCKITKDELIDSFIFEFIFFIFLEIIERPKIFNDFFRL